MLTIGLPHCLDPTTLETIGEEDLDGTLDLKVLGAHFRYDPTLDRLVTMSAKAGVHRLPSLQINEYGRQWSVKSRQVTMQEIYQYGSILIAFSLTDSTPHLNLQ